MPERVLVTGSINWTDINAIRSALLRLPPNSTIITGDTGGVDSLAIKIANELQLRVLMMQKTPGDAERHPSATWKGLSQRMIAAGVTLVLAFHPDIDSPAKARGTKHVLELAAERGITVEIHTCHQSNRPVS